MSEPIVCIDYVCDNFRGIIDIFYTVSTIRLLATSVFTVYASSEINIIINIRIIITFFFFLLLLSPKKLSKSLFHFVCSYVCRYFLPTF